MANDLEATVAKILTIKETNPGNTMAAVFDAGYYNSLDEQLKPRFLKCLNSGIENPDSTVGCYACQPDDYDVFKPFFTKVLQRYHEVDLSAKKHINNWSLDSVKGLPRNGVLDLSDLGLPSLSVRVRTARNLNRFPLPGSMTRQDRVDMEQTMGKVFHINSSPCQSMEGATLCHSRPPKLHRSDGVPVPRRCTHHVQKHGS